MVSSFEPKIRHWEGSYWEHKAHDAAKVVLTIIIQDESNNLKWYHKAKLRSSHIEDISV